MLEHKLHPRPQEKYLWKNLVAMSPTRIGIDFCVSPLRVGGLVLGKYIVVGGTKGLNLTGGSASTTKEEVVAALEDARDVVKSFFGAPGFDAAVVVIPNTTTEQNEKNIISHGRGRGFNITQVIREQVAVTAAYIEKVRPNGETTIAIISTTSGIIEVSVITIKVINARTVNYHLILRDHKVHDEPVDLEESKESSRGGLVGAVVKAVVVDPFEKAVHILDNVLGILDIGEAKVEKVVFVGKTSTSEKLRQAAKRRFRNAEEWEGIDDHEEVAAHGAAFLSDVDKRLQLSLPRSIADVGV